MLLLSYSKTIKKNRTVFEAALFEWKRKRFSALHTAERNASDDELAQKQIDDDDRMIAMAISM